MYKKILVPVENSAYDDAIIDHVTELARICKSAVVLIHVADGWAARNIEQLKLRESEEMKKDREYIEKLADELEALGLETFPGTDTSLSALGVPIFVGEYFNWAPN